MPNRRPEAALPDDWVERYFEARVKRALPPPALPVDRATEPEEPIDIAAYMARLSHEARTKAGQPRFELAVKHPLPPIPKPRLKDLLQHDDAGFVRAAYQTMLGRPPDPSGGAFYLASLGSGAIERTELLDRLRESPEGAAYAAEIGAIGLWLWLHRKRRDLRRRLRAALSNQA